MIRKVIPEKKWKLLDNHKRTIEWYETFNNIVTNLVIDLDKIKTDYRELRNKVVHSDILLFSNYILYNEGAKNLQDFDIENVIQRINTFQNNVMIFATEFDIRMLQLGIGGEDRYFDKWFRYFEIYSEDWQRIGPDIHDDNAW